MFTKSKDDAHAFTPAQDAVRSAASKPASKVGASIICADMEITGSITSEGALQIDGKVEGDVSAGDVTIGSTGVVTGEIKAETLRVKGHVKGAIRARKVELETGAHVEGDIFHAALIIQPEASFEGHVRRKENPLKEEAPRAAAAPSSPSPQGQHTSTSEEPKRSASPAGLGTSLAGPSGNA